MKEKSNCETYHPFFLHLCMSVSVCLCLSVSPSVYVFVLQTLHKHWEETWAVVA